MNRAVSVALLIIGVVLVLFGLDAFHSFGSDVSRAVNGAPTNKTIWLLVAGVLAGVIGLFGLFGNKSR